MRTSLKEKLLISGCQKLNWSGLGPHCVCLLLNNGSKGQNLISTKCFQLACFAFIALGIYDFQDGRQKLYLCIDPNSVIL